MNRLWPPDKRLLARPGFWLCVGLLVRLVHVATLGNRYFFGDTVEYEQAALRLIHGVQASGANPRQPVYPLLLALSFLLGGEQNLVFARFVQLLVSLVQMGLLVRLVRKIGGAPASSVAAPMVALAPTLVFVTGLLYPTLLYSTLVLALTTVAWDLAQKPTVGRGVGFGVLLVCGWLTDMVIVAPAFGIGVWLLVAGRRHGAVLARALAAAAITALVLAAPYLGRIRAQGSERVFMTKAQAVLHSARSDSVLSHERWIRFPQGAPFQPLSPQAFAARELGLFRERPVAFAHDYVLELLHFFKPLADRVLSQNRFNTLPVLLIGAIWFVGLLSLALVGLLAGVGSLRDRMLLASVVLATAAFYSFFFTQARYRIPIDPQLVALAALGVANAFPRFCQLLAEAGAEPAIRPATESAP
jgi:hypothetical protein